jgi:hypothetical protein
VESDVTSSAAYLAAFSLIVGTASALLVCVLGLSYLRHVRMERPAIGTFNGRDVVIVFLLLSAIPLFYLSLPRWLLSSFLVVTFVSALSFGLRPLLPPLGAWLVVGVLLGLNLWLGTNALGTVGGWQLFWAENDVIVLLAAVFVANLYVQGGMRLKHVAWFALALAAYDMVFTSVAPVTHALVEAFLGFPLNPSVGMRWGIDNAAIGIGDLLVYGLFVLAVAKGYGRRAGRQAVAVVLIFGAVAPALVPLLIDYVTARADTVVPAQVWFGPAAFLTWLWLRHRYGQERTMREFLASEDAARGRIGSPKEPGPISGAPRQPALSTFAAGPDSRPEGPVAAGRAGPGRHRALA